MLNDHWKKWKRSSWAFNRFKEAKISAQPHTMLPDDITLLTQLLEGTNIYLEYGCGGSTRLAAQHAKKVVSVENDIRYVKKLYEEFAKTNSNVEIIYADTGPVRRLGMPVFNIKIPFIRKSFENYALQPWKKLKKKEQYPDLVFIDGRFRVSCALASLCELPEASESIIFMDDYAGRPHYKVIEDFVEPLYRTKRAFVFKKASNFNQCKAHEVFQKHVYDPR